MEKPNIEKRVLNEKECLFIETTCDMKTGVVLTPSTVLSEECKKYEKEYQRNIWLLNKDDNQKDGDGNLIPPERYEISGNRGIMHLLEMGTRKGNRVEIYTEGQDEISERQILRLYSAFKSPSSYNLDFKAFE